MNLPTYQHPIEPLTSAQMRQLLADLNQARVATRKQGGSSLSYLEAWDVRASLIRIFGFGGFSAELVDDGVVHMRKDVPAIDYKSKQQRKDDNGELVWNYRITWRARVRLYIHQLGAFYTEGAISSQTGPDEGEVADFALKTAESDALKRAAINLGTQFGLSLYNDGSLADVVRRVLAPGQRPVDIDHGALALKAADEAKIAEIKAAAPVAAPAPEPTTETDVPMALAPTEEQMAAAAATLAGGFGGQA